MEFAIYGVCLRQLLMLLSALPFTKKMRKCSHRVALGEGGTKRAR